MSSAFVLSLLVLVQATAPGQGPSASAFDALARKAALAREAGRSDEAVAAYRAALEQRPGWDEGWWYLGVQLYEAQRCAEADAAFEKFLQLKPEAGPGWVIRGVCAFDRAEYPRAVEWIEKGIGLGLGGNSELLQVGVTRLALAHVKAGQFELAIPTLTILSRLAPDAPELVDATGLALLRLKLLPTEVPESRRDLVRRLGRAASHHLARRGDEAARAYAEVVAAYPEEARVRYAYGVFLLRSANEQGLVELGRAVELDPGDVIARLDLAFELLQRDDAAGARAHAARAVELAPALFAGHVALGRALLELGDLEGGVRELEAAVGLAPESAETHFALARAYAKAGRSEDAARERALFTALEQRGVQGQPPSGSGSVPGRP